MKGLIVDFDGTLACSDKTVSKRNIQAISDLIKRGGKVAVATGRMTYSAIHEILPKLSFKPYFATYDGCEIIDSDENLISSLKLTPDNEIEILKFAKETGVISQLYSDEVIVEKENEYSKWYCSISKCSLKAVGDLIDFVKTENFRSPKIVYLVEDERTEEILSALRNKFPHNAIAKGYKGVIDITPENITKGYAVKSLCSVW